MTETNETPTQVLKLELGFDPEATKVIEAMKDKAHLKSMEQLVSNALRVYDWYLDNHKHGLYTKRDDNWVKVELQL